MSLRDFLFYEEPGITLYCGDCREVLPLLRCPNTTYCLEECDGRCQRVLVTDPPYGHGDRWQGGTWGAAPMYHDAQRWDSERFPDADLGAMATSARVDACRNQGLPPGFLDGAPFTMAGKIKCVGNGVPLAMGRAIAKAVKRALDRRRR